MLFRGDREDIARVTTHAIPDRSASSFEVLTELFLDLQCYLDSTALARCLWRLGLKWLATLGIPPLAVGCAHPVWASIQLLGRSKIRRRFFP